MPTPEQIEPAVHTYVDSYNRGDLSGILSIFADDATVEDPVGTPLKTGTDAIGEFFGTGVAMGVRLHLDGPIRVGEDFACFPFHVLLEMEGKATRIDVIDVFRFNAAGKVVEMKAYFGPGNMRPA